MASEIILYQAKPIMLCFQVDYVSIPNSSRMFSFFFTLSANYKFKIAKCIVSIIKRWPQIA